MYYTFAYDYSMISNGNDDKYLVVDAFTGAFNKFPVSNNGYPFYIYSPLP